MCTALKSHTKKTQPDADSDVIHITSMRIQSYRFKRMYKHPYDLLLIRVIHVHIYKKIHVYISIYVIICMVLNIHLHIHIDILITLCKFEVSAYHRVKNNYEGHLIKSCSIKHHLALYKKKIRFYNKNKR